MMSLLMDQKEINYYFRLFDEIDKQKEREEKNKKKDDRKFEYSPILHAFVETW